MDRHFQSTAGLASCVTPSLKHRKSSTGIFSLLPITYAFRPRLRGRLTLGGRTFPRKPWDFGGKDSHLTFRYSCPHNHFHTVHARLPLRFDPYATLLYHADAPHRKLEFRIPKTETISESVIPMFETLGFRSFFHCFGLRTSGLEFPVRGTGIRSFGSRFSPVHFRRRTTRLVSCYALFKWWLPLSQHPSCLRSSTSLVTEPALGALAGDLGCFPFDYGAYPPQSNSTRV